MLPFHCSDVYAFLCLALYLRTYELQSLRTCYEMLTLRAPTIIVSDFYSISWTNFQIFPLGCVSYALVEDFLQDVILLSFLSKTKIVIYLKKILTLVPWLLAGLFGGYPELGPPTLLNSSPKDLWCYYCLYPPSITVSCWLCPAFVLLPGY